jgi:hypothetical protein
MYYVELLRDAYQYLCNHPERVEDVVKERVLAGKFTKLHNSFQWLHLELQVINTWILDETFSGDTICTMPIRMKRQPSRTYIEMMMKRPSHAENGAEWAFSNEKEIDDAYQYYMKKNFGNRIQSDK